MDAAGVRRLVFSSSATVYGASEDVPLIEKAPLDATNPYGRTKEQIEDILSDLGAADPRWSIALLRYFNPVGAHESGLIGEDPRGIPNNLLPFVAQVAVGRREKVMVFGNDYPTPDGTGVRDYIHVMDLAAGHLAALGYLATKTGVFRWNLGTGRGSSVLEVIEAFGTAAGHPIPYEFAPRRPGDAAVSYADPSAALADLGWSAHRNLAQMCEDHWRWQSSNPHGLRRGPRLRGKPSSVRARAQLGHAPLPAAYPQTAACAPLPACPGSLSFNPIAAAPGTGRQSYWGPSWRLCASSRTKSAS